MMDFLPFFIILFVGVFFSDLFRRLHLPWVIALILGGIIIGPYALDLIEINTTIEFIGEIGLVFLMFMAGLHIKTSSFKRLRKGVSYLALLNGVIPFAVGFGIGLLFKFSFLSSALLGVVFISSSIAVVIPSLQDNKLMESHLGKSIVATTVIEDGLSLVILSILIQTVEPFTVLPLPVFYIILFVSLIFLRWAIPKIRWLFYKGVPEGEDLFEQELRSIIVILVGTVILFEILGLHPIIAGFFAGLVLADTIKSDTLKQRLNAISYGVFIPTFFIVAGMETNISVLSSAKGVIIMTAAIVFGSILSKFISGYFGGRIIGFNHHRSLIIASSTIPQLSTSLAVVFTAVELNLLKEELITAMVVLSVLTTFISPLLVKYFVGVKRRSIEPDLSELLPIVASVGEK